MAAVEKPRSLKDVQDLECGVSFPGPYLAGSETALCLFSAAWHGKQDAFWVNHAGMTATCVDLDQERLDEMAAIYPNTWSFARADAFEFAEAAADEGERWDVVTLDPFTNVFQRVADELPLFCALANNVVMHATGPDTQVTAPSGWRVATMLKRSTFRGGVWWTVLERV